MKSFDDSCRDLSQGKDDMGTIFFRTHSKTEGLDNRDGRVLVHVTGPENPGEYWVVSEAYANMLTMFGNNNTRV